MILVITYFPRCSDRFIDYLTIRRSPPSTRSTTPSPTSTRASILRRTRSATVLPPLARTGWRCRTAASRRSPTRSTPSPASWPRSATRARRSTRRRRTRLPPQLRTRLRLPLLRRTVRAPQYRQPTTAAPAPTEATPATTAGYARG